MKILLLVVAIFTLCGCQTSAPPLGARLSRAQALDVARQAAAEQMINLRDYQRTPLMNFGLWAEGKWEILWPNSTLTEGFQVIIEDKTGKIVSAKKVPVGHSTPPMSSRRMMPPIYDAAA